MHERGGVHHGFVEIFCLTGPKRKALYRNPSVFQKSFGIEKDLWIRGGISRFSVEIFMSHSAEKFRGHPFNVSENLGYRKILCIIGGITIFRRKLFVSQFLVSKTFMDKRGEGVSRFSVQNFLSLSAEKFCSETFQCVSNFVYRKILCFRELCHDFVLKFFCLTVPKNFIREPFCAVFQKISGSEKAYG